MAACDDNGVTEQVNGRTTEGLQRAVYGRSTKCKVRSCGTV